MPELMLLGFISLLLTVFQGALQKVCVKESIMHHLLPCSKETVAAKSTKHLAVGFINGAFGGARRLLASSGGSDYCTKKVLP
jgi:mlo protein